MTAARLSIRIEARPFDPDAEAKVFRAANPSAGAIVTFVGQVRGDGGVEKLLLEHYPGFTEATIEEVAKRALDRRPLQAVSIVHRVGALFPGEPIVFVAAAASHRRPAFEAADFLMDYLKTEAPFWKREIAKGAARWIDPTDQDYAERARWDAPQRQEGPMAGVNDSFTFVPLRIALLTVSDTRTLAEDASGDALKQRLEDAGHILADRALERDDVAAIRTRLEQWIGDPAVDVVISTGGTGLTGRDVTVEAARPLFEKEIEGFSVLFHQISYKTVGLSTLQSRACAGLARGTVVFLLPGSTGAVKDGWDNIIRHQLDARYRPCNLVELMPRFEEQ